MKLDIKAFALAIGLLRGVAMLLTGIGNLLFPGYGQDFLNMMGTIYPGYEAVPSIAQIAIGTIYGLVDGAIGGALLAWLYNCFAPSA